MYQEARAKPLGVEFEVVELCHRRIYKARELQLSFEQRRKATLFIGGEPRQPLGWRSGRDLTRLDFTFKEKLPTLESIEAG